MGLKVEALRVATGKTLIDLENGSLEALKGLLSTCKSLDSLVNQATDNPNYTDEDVEEMKLVKAKVIENLEVVLEEYKK